MKTTVRVLAAMLFCSACVSRDVSAAEYVQKLDCATIQIKADKVEGDTVEIRLSGTMELSLTTHGGLDTEVEDIQALTTSKNWTVREELNARSAYSAREGWSKGRTFILEPMNRGELPLQISPLRYRQKGEGEWKTLTWKPITVRVTSTVPNVDLGGMRDITPLMRDITPPEEPPPASRTWYQVFIGAGLALVCVGLLLGGWQLKRRFTSPAAPLPPHEWAARELERLQSQALPESGQAERFHTLLSDLVRRYLELRFDLHAPRQTTAEFLDSMRQAPQLTPAQQAMLRDFLERCDLAKFARADYSSRECQAAADTARAFVEQTASAKRG
jgi:hypothetical protein